MMVLIDRRVYASLRCRRRGGRKEEGGVIDRQNGPRTP